MPEITQDSLPTTTPLRKGGGARIMFVVLVVLALAGIIVYLLSLLNSKKFFLVPEGGLLLVKKGIFFPAGSEVYQPQDAGQEKLYDAIELPEELQRAGAIEFEDLPSLNREFAKYLIKLATEMVFADDDSRYRKGKGYLERVRKLHGLDPDQVDRIKSLRADVDYVEAKRAYLGAEKTLDSALKKFKQAETFGTGRFPDSGEWIRKIEVLLEAIRATKASEPTPAQAKPEQPRPAPLPPKTRETATPPGPSPSQDESVLEVPENERQRSWPESTPPVTDGI